MRMPTFGLPRSVLPVFWGIMFIEACFGAYLGVWPLWMERLGAEVGIIGLLLGAGGFIRVFIMAPSATIAERVGIRRLLLATRVGILVGYLVSFFAGQWWLLLVQVVLAAAAEIAFPLTQGYIARHCREDQRMRAFTVVYTIGPSIVLIVSPLISGAVVALFGIRAAFMLAAIFAAMSILAFMRMEPDAPVAHHDAVPTSSYRQALAQPPVRLLLALQFVMLLVLSLGIGFIPTFLEQVQGIDAATIATLGAIPAVGSMVFGFVVARNHWLQHRPFAAAGIAIAQAVVGFWIFRNFAAVPVLAVAFFLRGGIFSGWAMLAAGVGSMSVARHRARSFTASEMVGGVAFSLGPIIGGQLYPRRETLPFELAILFGVVLVPVFFLAQRRSQRQLAVMAAAEEAGEPSA